MRNHSVSHIVPQINCVTLFHTDIASQDGNPTSFDAASRSMVLYTERICFGAATVPGLANCALISTLSAGDSFGMLLKAKYAATASLYLYYRIMKDAVLFQHLC